MHLIHDQVKPITADRPLDARFTGRIRDLMRSAWFLAAVGCLRQVEAIQSLALSALPRTEVTG